VTQEAESSSSPSSTVATSERRNHERKQLRSELSLWTEHNFYTGFTEDISEGGLFVATHEFLPVGSPIDLELELPGGHALRVRGIVRWVRDPHDPGETIPGMGIQFETLAPADLAAISEFMRNREPMFWDQ